MDDVHHTRCCAESLVVQVQFCEKNLHWRVTSHINPMQLELFEPLREQLEIVTDDPRDCRGIAATLIARSMHYLEGTQARRTG